MSDSNPPELRLEEIFRREWGRVVAVLARLLGDLDRAEECAQAALIEALERWPLAGVPEKPGAWLMTTARNRALDALRADSRARAREDRLAYHEAMRQDEVSESPEEALIESDQLKLMFTCCHPSLPRESRIALTLRLLGGLTTQEIAAAFLISEANAAQRIVRAKRAIRDRRLPYRVPDAAELPERLPAVLDVVYLIYNAGYDAHEGQVLIRHSLCEDALGLGRILGLAFPHDGEVLGLLALMEIQSSRQNARVAEDGSLVLLEDQDRSLWDRVRIERARRLLDRANEADRSIGTGPFALQAGIAACHATAACYANTDWNRIAGLYGQLSEQTGSPVVELNRIIAVGMTEGFEVALDQLDRLSQGGRLDDYRLVAATRADFLRRLSRLEEAAAEYRRALAHTQNATEKRFLEARLADCLAKCEDGSTETSIGPPGEPPPGLS